MKNEENKSVEEHDTLPADVEIEKKDPECRKWLFTCNNPEEHGWTSEKIIEILENWKAVKYWCIGFERGVENDTPHYHFFIYGTSAIKASTIEKKLHGINRQMVNGSILANRTYCWKDGTYIGTEKGNKHDYASNIEKCEPPEEKKQGQRTDMVLIKDAIKAGKTNIEIIEAMPDAIKYYGLFDKIRQDFIFEECSMKERDVKVHYIWGTTGSGKTSGIFKKHGYADVYRVTNYKHPFDGYKGQPIIVFDEFRNQFSLDAMLNYTDVHPCELMARYANKQACYTTVYIISNWDIREQYKWEQAEDVRSWNAFLRRVVDVTIYTGEAVLTFPTKTYMEEEWRFYEDGPFVQRKQPKDLNKWKFKGGSDDVQ